MAVTITPYNHTAAKLQTLDIDANAANFKVELLNDSASFTGSHTAKSSVDNSGAYEVYGNGWAQGGEALASVTVTTVNTNASMFDAADLSITATGGAIGPAYKALLYVDEGGAGTTKTPLFFIAFGESKTASEGNTFNINWNASGIFTITPSA